MPFVLPAHHRGVRWECVVDTRERTGRCRSVPLRGGETYEMEARSFTVFRLAGSRRGPRPGVLAGSGDADPVK